MPIVPKNIITGEFINHKKSNYFETWIQDNFIQSIDELFKHPKLSINQKKYTLLSTFPKLNLDTSILVPRIGLEIELESISERVQNYSGTNFGFLVKGDGSLRNGYEIISPALCADQVSNWLASIYTYISLFGASSESFSWRTSIHVHLDCRQLPVEFLKRLLILYCIFEDSLFQFANPGRQETNIFCAPITRTNFYALQEFIHAPNDNFKILKHALTNLTHTIQKYSALNLCHLWDFGSIEFRHMRGTNKPIHIQNWIQLLLNLYFSAQRISKQSLLKTILELNTTSAYHQFALEIFGENSNLFYTDIPTQFRRLSRGISLVKEILFGYNNKINVSNNSGLHAFVSFINKSAKSDPLQLKLNPK